MVLVVMGVSGCGKSTLGRALAEALGWDFLEGDDLHSRANVDRMAAGIALNDDDRWPWLDRIAAWIRSEAERDRQAVVACSALRRSYRDRLRGAGVELRLVHVRVTRGELEHRLAQRTHFMPASLLDSQLGTLEPPGADEDALTLSGEAGLDAMIAQVRHWLGPRIAHPADRVDQTEG
jgi:carbohydrate kinase, thermoresistant glucokinase family